MEPLNSVIMYDEKTGTSKKLPSLNHKRIGSVAVATGNEIIVSGGYDSETQTHLDSVEYFDLKEGSAWREMSPKATKRAYVTAVLKPIQ